MCPPTDATHAVTCEKPDSPRQCSDRILARSRSTCHNQFFLFLVPPSPIPPFQTLAMLKSVVQRVCSIPELLHFIFDHLDSSSNVNNALVCKLWSEVARDKLWFEVRNPRRLLSILAPISAIGVGAVAVFRINDSSYSLGLREEIGAKGLVSVYDIRSPRSQV